MEALTGAKQRYHWGSTTALPEFAGFACDGRPLAEIWFGAHPLGPTLCEDGLTLAQRLSQDPISNLGADVAKEFRCLPFLLKLIAPAAPLSLQVHPTRARAKAKFEREDRLGIPIDSPERNYKDANHKPELVLALETFQALAGFRAPRRAAEVLFGLENKLTLRMAENLAKYGGKDGIRAAVTELLTSDPDPDLVAAAAHECGVRLAAGVSPSARIDAMVVRLQKEHPGDRGVLVALLLNPVTLQPGEAMFVPAGMLHAYVQGTAVEIMASSDNVLRAGLTTKHVDIAETIACTDWSAAPPMRIAPELGVEQTAVYYAPVDDFELTVSAATQVPRLVGGRGPRIVLVIDGQVEVSAGGQSLRLRRGEAAFVPACDGPVSISGQGRIVQADVP